MLLFNQYLLCPSNDLDTLIPATLSRRRFPSIDNIILLIKLEKNKGDCEKEYVEGWQDDFWGFKLE